MAIGRPGQRIWNSGIIMRSIAQTSMPLINIMARGKALHLLKRHGRHTAGGSSRSVQPEQDCNVVHQHINCNRGHCRMCGLITRWMCECLPQSPPAPGAKRRKEGSVMYLCPASKRRCLIQHIEGNAL